MTPGTLVLLHGPLTTAAVWGSLPETLRAQGARVVVPEVVVPETQDVGGAPHSGRYVAAAALAIAAAAPAAPLVLVAHGAAGALLPSLGAAQRAAHRRVGGYVFVDAELPGPSELRQDWPDAPCGYLRTAPERDGDPGEAPRDLGARQARMRGWPVAELDQGHADDPAGAAVALREVIEAL
jgi:hypothetical protein